MSDKLTQDGLTRRSFAKAVGVGSVVAGATVPAAADERRGTDRVGVDDVAREDAIEEPFSPGEWLTVGPFHYQRRDSDPDWLYPAGGSDALAGGETAVTDEPLFSAVAAGGQVSWTHREVDGSTLAFDFDDEFDPTDGEVMPLSGGDGLLDDLQDWYGYGGVGLGKGFAFAVFERDEPGIAVLEHDASQVWLNGDHHEAAAKGVVLQEGENYLLVEQSITFGDGSVSVEFRPPRAPVEVDDLAVFDDTPQNVIVPDLWVDEPADEPASVRVTNVTPEPVENATLTFGTADGPLEEQTVEISPPLAPFETRRVNTRVVTEGAGSTTTAVDAATATDDIGADLPETAMAASDIGKRMREQTGPPAHADANAAGEADGGDGGEVAADTDGDDTAVVAEAGTLESVATVAVGDASDSRTVPIRVRDRSDNYRQSTFVSRHDESVQTFAYRLPADYDETSGPYELLVSLHGANVEPESQASANLDWDGRFVVAPAARGPVNYDHEGLGRLDDLEAIDEMAARFDVDPDAVYLSGHSMGGHGTIHVGLTHSGRFAGIAPSASWTTHDQYLTTPFERDKLYTHPRLKAVRDTSLRKDQAFPTVENAADGELPVFLLHGAVDQSVPPLMPRTLARSFANHGLDVQGEVGDRFSTPDPDAVDVGYLEVPGAGHWWDKGLEDRGNDSVNHPDLMEFLFSNRRDPYADRVRFVTTNLRVEHQKKWLAVLEQDTVHATTRVDASVKLDGIHVETENVARLRIDTRVFEEADVDADNRFVVNGDAVTVPPGRIGDELGVVIDERARLGGNRGRKPGRGPRKGPDQYGPLREVHYDPYLLVYATGGSDADTALARNLANVRSERLVERARAPAPVVPDTAVGRDELESYNLVLFGQPGHNAVLDDLAGDLPIEVGDGYVSLAGETYEGDYGVEYVYPTPGNDDRLLQVTTGSSREGLLQTRTRNWIPTFTPAADFAVYDETIRYRGWDACVAAGYFDVDWRIDEEVSYIRRRTNGYSTD